MSQDIEIMKREGVIENLRIHFIEIYFDLILMLVRSGTPICSSDIMYKCFGVSSSRSYCRDHHKTYMQYRKSVPCVYDV